jgi:hypothetical protein
MDIEGPESNFSFFAATPHLPFLFRLASFQMLGSLPTDDPLATVCRLCSHA